MGEGLPGLEILELRIVLGESSNSPKEFSKEEETGNWTETNCTADCESDTVTVGQVPYHAMVKIHVVINKFYEFKYGTNPINWRYKNARTRKC